MRCEQISSPSEDFSRVVGLQLSPIFRLLQAVVTDGGESTSEGSTIEVNRPIPRSRCCYSPHLHTGNDFPHTSRIERSEGERTVKLYSAFRTHDAIKRCSVQDMASDSAVQRERNELVFLQEVMRCALPLQISAPDLRICPTTRARKMCSSCSRRQTLPCLPNKMRG